MNLIKLSVSSFIFVIFLLECKYYAGVVQMDFLSLTFSYILTGGYDEQNERISLRQSAKFVQLVVIT